MLWFGAKKKQSPKVKIVGTPKAQRYRKQSLSLEEFKKWSPGSASIPLTGDIISDRAQFLKTYFGLVCRYVPIATQAVWTWRNLCATRQEVKFEGGSDAQRRQAAERIGSLDKRLTPFSFAQGGGMDKLISLWFTNVFTYGRFAGNIVISPNMDEILEFKRVDPFKVKISKEGKAYVEDENNPSKGKEQSPSTFYYFGIGMDDENPYGSAFCEAADTFMQIAMDMMTDMALSSSNAGIPRLHIKVKQPPIQPNEDPANYSTRVNNYFDATVSEMSELAPDDNIYSWDDVEIAIAGGESSPTAFVWGTNRAVVDEEIIAAFHLFPWVIGRSASTTKNWVTSQFDLLMSMAESFQREAKRFSEWIANIDLALAGINNVRAVRTFSQPRDPAAKEQAIAQRFLIANVKSKILMGTIDPDTGARELGYDQAYKPGLVYKTNKVKEEPINKDDKADRQPPAKE